MLILKLTKIHEKIKQVAYLMAIKTVKSDDLWLSEAFAGGQKQYAAKENNFIAIHFTLQQNVTAVDAFLPAVEAVLKRFQARPHWGKYFKMSPSQFLPLYPKLNDFK